MNQALAPTPRTRAQESRAAVQRLYIAMQHLFIRGFYKPLGVSGEAIRDALMVLRPEIYGSIADEERVELNGLFYVFQRLPMGIEECRFVKLVSREGLEETRFDPIVPNKRRRKCYRIDDEQVFIEMTRGRSDIYDILTHLTFMYIESEKIRDNILDHDQQVKREWRMLEEIVEKEERGEEFNREVAYTYLSTILGRTYQETVEVCRRFRNDPMVNSLFHVTYWLGRRSLEEYRKEKDREITFSSALRERIGHHYYGEAWANNIKRLLSEEELLERPIHILSANLHSVMNTFYGFAALPDRPDINELEELARDLSQDEQEKLRLRVKKYALQNGMYQIDDMTGTNISVQVFDTSRIKLDRLPTEVSYDAEYIKREKPVILVMDYAFGEQAYETMDELLKPFGKKELDVRSIGIMGKAGILEGKKSDIMVATAHVFEGTADNYPLQNEFQKSDFEGYGLGVYEGPMITVLGTSLQNREILRFFLESSWNVVGLEMEGAHYQKAIQAAAKIRGTISAEVRLMYAYYASDNPLETGSTLASGSLGLDGVKPTYLITAKMLGKILQG
ncbi:MAG TPA: hypothetical protein VJ953_20610 [Saprospiraceae bacterium]|nr:hypothetical protein [Saprospiraceae bacterium]